ncbi:hypothetical protein AB0J72_11845 [Dactylosporangium sp. NPDC049742]|uniref:hypothetical protein n=1 Tax=Dactylosporangium sp. NPDC049742 TaxID=3154737 RepID=UPI0034456A5D
MTNAQVTPRRRGALGAALSLAFAMLVPLAVPAAPAGAAPPGAVAEAEIARILAADPAATRLSADQVAWPDDGVVLTVTGEAAGSWCGTGRACVYADANRAGYGYAFYRCGAYRLPEYGFPTGQRAGASSWYNNQTGGAKIRFEDEWFTLTPVLAGSGFGNMPSYLNDRAYWLDLLC